MIHLPAAQLRAVAVGAVLFVLAVSQAASGAEPASWPDGRNAATPAAESRFYMLSFTDEPVTDVAEAVLGSALNRPFTVAEDVDGVMSFRVEESLNEAALLRRFSAALAAEGIAVSSREGRLILSAAPTPVATPSTETLDRPAPATPPSEPPAAVAVDQPDLLWPGVGIGLGAALLLGGLAWGWSARRGAAAGERPSTATRQAVLDRLLRDHPVPPDRLAAACTAAARGDEPAERALAHSGDWSYEQLAEAYAEASGCTLWRPAQQPAKGLSEPELGATLARLRLVAVSTGGSRLAVATDDPLDEGRLLTLAAAAGRPVRVLTGTIDDVAAALAQAGDVGTASSSDDGARLLAEVLQRRP